MSKTFRRNKDDNNYKRFVSKKARTRKSDRFEQAFMTTEPRKVRTKETVR